MIIPKLLEELSGSQEIEREFQTVLRNNASNYFDPALSRTLENLAQRGCPPSNNMGGTYSLPPPFIPHGEKSPAFVVKQKTKIDWLAFTSSAEIEALKVLLSIMWPSVVFSRNAKGMFGYPESSNILVDEVQYGVMCYGAAHGRNYVSLPGTSSKTLTDEMVELFHEALSLPELNVTLSRLDLCLDFYRGERTFDHAKHAYDNGKFRRPRANSDPEIKVIDVRKEGRNLGRTMYCGRRGGHVYTRVYEKGLEVFAKLPEELRLLSTLREIESAVPDDLAGFVADDWLRLEVEYQKQGKDVLLPLEMMLQRDEYFAGANPYFAEALGVVDGIRPPRLKPDFEVDLDRMVFNARRSYGSLVHSLTQIGWTASDIVADLTTGRNNDKLVKSGLFTVCRQAAEKVESERLRADPDWDIPF